MTWLSVASKLVTEPAFYVSIDFNSGLRYYSDTWLRLSAFACKGNILSISRIAASVGDIKRTYEQGKINIVFADTDKEFRTLLDDENPNLKNRTVTITAVFVDDDFATTKVLFTGQIYDWRMSDDLKFEIDVEEKSVDLENFFPDQEVNRTDYANAHGESVGLSIPIPYGAISALGDSADGAFGHPALTDGSGLLFVDTSTDAEIHLVGMQTAAITVDRVYLDKRDGNGAVLQTEGAGNDYQINTQVIDGKTHTLIEWEAGVNPLPEHRVSCDITFGSRLPVEGMRHFLENFSSYGSFNAAAYATAQTTEAARDYDFAGCVWNPKALRTILDEWRDQWELDIYWNKAGEVVFKYITAVIGSDLSEYNDLNDILEGFDSDPQVHEIINSQRYGYKKHWSQTYYENYATYENTPSQTKHGGTFKGEFLGLEWTRTASVSHDIASRKVIRFKDPITFVMLRLPIKSYDDDLADMVLVSHDYGLGSSGYALNRFHIRSIDYNLDDYTNDMVVEDARNFTGSAFILGDGLLLPADWDLAVGPEKDYGFLGDSTDDMMDNDLDPAKRLFD